MPNDSEYLLQVWKNRPESPDDNIYLTSHWTVRVHGAPSIPRVGEKICCPSGNLDDYEEYRVFDVAHIVKGGGLSALVTEGMSTIKDATTPAGDDGLTRVLAYQIRL